MDNYNSPGDTLTLTAPSGGVEGGKGYQIGQLFVVAVADAAEGEPFAGKVTGVHELPRKVADAAWTQGALVYWDAAEAEMTTTGTSNLLIGAAAAPALSAATVGLVRLNGSARPQEAGGG